jgi:hypothetical protein
MGTHTYSAPFPLTDISFSSIFRLYYKNYKNRHGLKNPPKTQQLEIFRKRGARWNVIKKITWKDVIALMTPAQERAYAANASSIILI